MKNGTFYAGQVKKFYAKLSQSVPLRPIPEPDDPLRRLVIALLAVGSSEAEAEQALNQALSTMVDLNEVRVSSAHELNKATGNGVPDGMERCQRVIDALQAVYNRENRMSLDRLKGMGRREARHYLEELEGVDEYASASVVLWSLGGHAIPVNDRLLRMLLKEKLIHPSSTRAEVQAFLERHVSAADAKTFCMIMGSLAEAGRQTPRKGRTGASAKAPGGAHSAE